MMNRREFIKRVAGAAGGVVAGGAVGFSGGPQSEAKNGMDYAAARRLLAEHKIAQIEFHGINDDYGRAIGPNSRGGHGGQRGGGAKVAVIVTDHGITGWAMAGGAAEADAARFVGAGVAGLFDAEKGLADDAPWWLDKVLHDLAARILNVPVWRMLGAAGRRDVLLYSGAIYMDDLFPEHAPQGVAGLVANCRMDYEAGYRAFKLKVGRGRQLMSPEQGLRRDIEVVRAVHEAFPDCRILVDANDGWSPDEASRFVDETADCDLYWIEEPFEENRDNLRRLRDSIMKTGKKILVADGESRRDKAASPTEYGGYTTAFIDNLYALAAEKLVDVFVLDLDIVGFSRWRRIMPKLAAAGVAASPHTWMWRLRSFYAAQLAAGVGNIGIVEGIPGVTSAVDESAYAMKDGRLCMPDAPGFGLDIKAARR